ncbi:MAG: GNAT family N-acetyltransferase [Nocardioidaceae bacterium]
MLRTPSRLQRLGPSDLARLRPLLDRDPVTNVFVDSRIQSTGLDPRRLSGEVWGYGTGRDLTSACHVAANLMPVEATPPAIRVFAEHAAAQGRRCSSLVGLQRAITPLWEHLEPHWGPARSVRPDQPFMTISAPSAIRPDPAVRRVLVDELDLLYPASVAMFTEEVGVSPEIDGADYYRARVAQLISRGWAFARIDDGQVIFKAEVGVATDRACQIQGVYVHPDYRGRGISAAAMAAVVNVVLAEIAPVVTLYVNADNTAARRAYEHAGFVRTNTFTTVLF